MTKNDFFFLFQHAICFAIVVQFYVILLIFYQFAAILDKAYIGFKSCHKYIRESATKYFPQFSLFATLNFSYHETSQNQLSNTRATTPIKNVSAAAVDKLHIINLQFAILINCIECKIVQFPYGATIFALGNTQIPNGYLQP